jgi:3-hydroxyacyl-CoA dehydrogenase
MTESAGFRDVEHARIGVIGAGLIGRGWSTVFARAGHPVAIYDDDPGALERGLAAIDGILGELERAGVLSEPAAVIRARITAVDSLEAAAAEADYVQECAAELLEVKKTVFAALNASAPKGAVLASSTSMIPASTFSAGLSAADRCVVVHPAHPVHLMPVVEISPSPWTSAATVERTRALQASVGQSPVVLRREIQGFILNRLQGAVLREAVSLWANGYASADDIDRTVRDGLGLRWSFMGPLETFDLAAPGGIADSARRYGPGFAGIAATSTEVEWTPELMARLEAERAAIQPRETLAERGRWRDRRLTGLLVHKRAAAERDRADAPDHE